MNPYASLGRGQYGDADVMREMQGAGMQPPFQSGGFPAMGGGGMMQSGNMGGNPFASQQMMPSMAPMGMMQDPYARDFSSMPNPMMRAPGTMYDPMGGMGMMNDGQVVAERIDEAQFIGQKVVGQEWIYGAKPYVTMEKYVEIPQTIIKEHTRAVPKPEIVERIIQVPKIGYNERTIKGPDTTVFKEGIAEVFKGTVMETRQRPNSSFNGQKAEIQERLIEIPKIEHRERIEYEDRIEYREVPVDKIIEVPEIEYRIREVERFVPQTYVQEYFVDRYTEVPVVQVQEVERYEHVPVVNPVPNYRAVGIPVPVPMTPERVAVPVAVPTPVGVPVPVPVPYGVPVEVPSSEAANLPYVSAGMPSMQMNSMGMMGQGMPMASMGPGMPMGSMGPGMPMGSMGPGMPMGRPASPRSMGTGNPFASMGAGMPMGSMGPGMPMGSMGPGIPMGSMGPGNMMNTMPGMPPMSMGNMYANYDPGMSGRAVGF